jgi:hypothetical protein
MTLPNWVMEAAQVLERVYGTHARRDGAYDPDPGGQCRLPPRGMLAGGGDVQHAELGRSWLSQRASSQRLEDLPMTRDTLGPRLFAANGYSTMQLDNKKVLTASSRPDSIYRTSSSATKSEGLSVSDGRIAFRGSSACESLVTAKSAIHTVPVRSPRRNWMRFKPAGAFA